MRYFFSLLQREVGRLIKYLLACRCGVRRLRYLSSLYSPISTNTPGSLFCLELDKNVVDEWPCIEYVESADVLIISLFLILHII